MNDKNDVCKAHSGFKTKIEVLEDNVAELWKKWNGMQRILFGILGGVILNLVVLLVNLMTK